MIPSRPLLLSFPLLVSSFSHVDIPIGGLSGSHVDIPRWCGKPYEVGSPNYDPGGQLVRPSKSSVPLLNLRISPRYSIYDSSEKSGQFIVDASLTQTHGQPYGSDCKQSSNDGKHDDELEITIRLDNGNHVLVSDSVIVNSADNLLNFDFGSLTPQLEPYIITLFAHVRNHPSRIYTAHTELYYLPAKKDGSTVKLDNLYGGMLVANEATNFAFEPLLPFGLYTQCAGYLNYSHENVTAYKMLGFNAINPVCAFTDGDLTFLFDWLDAENLWYQYDMRNSYLNLSSVAEQIPHIKDRSNLLSWYTGDEPDGTQYNLSSTKVAYDFLKQQDPYHPTSLVLNCENYYFEEYSSGADYIMEDAYPIGINPTFSRKFHTPCNETYGDCGCDNCIHSLFDVSNRLDTFVEYQDWLGVRQKPQWAVLQAFSGEKYWARSPSPEETWVMMLLSFNHMAKAIMSWTFPTTPLSLGPVHGAMAKVVTSSPVRDFLIGGNPQRLAVRNHPLFDVAYWVTDTQIMVSVANVATKLSQHPLRIKLPVHVSKISSQPWGSILWYLDEEQNLSTTGLEALASSIIVLDL